MEECPVEIPEVLFSFLSMRKSFGSVEALRDGRIDIRPGHCHAIVGDNGAGKSTFLKLIAGAEVPDGGTEIGPNGQEVRITSPQDAMELGIATVYQNLALAENRSVAENVFLGNEPRRFGMIRRREMEERAAVALRKITTRDIPIGALVSNLSGGQRQAVALSRAVVDETKTVVLLDEPTAALGIQESRHVLDAIRGLRDTGMGVVMISHSLAHVFEVADDITVFRAGRVTAFLQRAETTPDEVVSYITGLAGADDTEEDS